MRSTPGWPTHWGSWVSLKRCCRMGAVGHVCHTIFCKDESVCNPILSDHPFLYLFKKLILICCIVLGRLLDTFQEAWFHHRQGSHIVLSSFPTQGICHFVVLPRLMHQLEIGFTKELSPCYLLWGQLLLGLEYVFATLTVMNTNWYPKYSSSMPPKSEQPPSFLFHVWSIETPHPWTSICTFLAWGLHLVLDQKHQCLLQMTSQTREVWEQVLRNGLLECVEGFITLPQPLIILILPQQVGQWPNYFRVTMYESLIIVGQDQHQVIVTPTANFANTYRIQPSIYVSFAHK